MCKKAMISKNYKELDEAIKQKLPPYLYNGGKGKNGFDGKNKRNLILN